MESFSPILGDLEEVEVKIFVKPSTMEYRMEIETIKLGTLYNVLKDIISTIEDGTFMNDDELNVWEEDEDKS